MYKIVLTKDAVKYYRKSDNKTKRQLNEAFSNLKANPINGANIKRLHGELTGLFRYRVANLRVVYKVEEQNVTIIVLAIGSRGDIYK